ncbi:Tetraacyldisaccharide 4'-kinase [hydrothermal vent metagenome]|uniref:tetraacyldisaccharide 4'-kinase n=1 Tax=hydrothermal vent metagenome TaxID=652676 RepID=A0A3B0XZ26_9ZZZZ
MNRVRLENWFNRIWYSDIRPPWWLLPFSWLYCGVVYARQLARRLGLLKVVYPGVATIVVGNLTVGGTGKTPFVIALSRLLSVDGLRVGIVTRGYGGDARDWPCEVTTDSDPLKYGDEAVLLAGSTGVPVYAGPDRLAAARALLAEHSIDVLISDDGLQHTRLGRDIEIVMIDPERSFGNGICLPAGPLREPLSRLEDIDATVALGMHPAAKFQFAAAPGEAINLATPARRLPLKDFAGKPCHAVTGIANPERFFRMLKEQGLQPDTRCFEDHHAFNAADIRFDDDSAVLMTAKDAVKCRKFANSNDWYVPLELHPDPAFKHWLLEILKRKTNLG